MGEAHVVAHRQQGARPACLGDGTPDARAAGSSSFRALLYLELPFFDHNHRFLPALVLRQGGRVQSIAVNHRPRERGTSNYHVFDNGLWVGITRSRRRDVALLEAPRRLNSRDQRRMTAKLPARRRGAFRRAKIAGRVLWLLVLVAGLTVAIKGARGGSTRSRSATPSPPIYGDAAWSSSPRMSWRVPAFHSAHAAGRRRRSALRRVVGRPFWAALGGVLGAVAGFLVAALYHRGGAGSDLENGYRRSAPSCSRPSATAGAR